MISEHWCVFLGLVTLVAGGIVKMPEELPVDIAADNAYLDDFASNALLSVEERKIVALLDDDDDDVTMNINYDKKHKHRSAPTDGDAEGDAAYQHWYTNTYLPWYQNYAVAFAKWSCERLSTRDANPLFIDANQPCWVEADGVCGEADGAGNCAVA